MKFRNHPSITAIKNLNKGTRFDFCRVSVQDVVKEIKKLSTRKSAQSTDIPVKTLKENADIFGRYTCDFFNGYVERRRFPFSFKTGKYHVGF